MDFTKSMASRPFARLPTVPFQVTYTVPLLVTAMSADWLPRDPSEMRVGLLKVSPWSVERTNLISLFPRRPWKTLTAPYTLPR